MSRSAGIRLGLLLALAGLAATASPVRATMPPLPGNPVPEEVAAAFREGLFALPERPVGLGVSAVQSLWRIPVVLVAYADDSLTFGAAAFDSALFDTTGSTATGSVFDYYRWASGNRMTVTGKVVATVRVANDKLYYGFNCVGPVPDLHAPQHRRAGEGGAGFLPDAGELVRLRPRRRRLRGHAVGRARRDRRRGLPGSLRQRPVVHHLDPRGLLDLLQRLHHSRPRAGVHDPLHQAEPLHHAAGALALPRRQHQRDRGVLPRVRPRARAARPLRRARRGPDQRGAGLLVAHGLGRLGRQQLLSRVPDPPRVLALALPGLDPDARARRGHRRHADPDPPGPAGARAVVPGRVGPGALPRRGAKARGLRPQAADGRAHRHARGRRRDRRRPGLEPRELGILARAGRGGGRRRPRPHDRRQPRRLGRPLPGGRGPARSSSTTWPPPTPSPSRATPPAWGSSTSRRPGTAGASAPRCRRSAGSRRGT